MSESEKNEKLEYLKRVAREKVAKEAQAFKVDLQPPKHYAGRVDIHAMDKKKPEVKYCLQFANQPDTLNAPLLSGKSGCGKTHLIWATLMEMVKIHNGKVDAVAEDFLKEVEPLVGSGKPVPAFTSRRMAVCVTKGIKIAQNLRSSIARGDSEKTLEAYFQEKESKDGVAVLCVDDIEVEKMSDWLHGELYNIFDTRHDQNSPTFVTTNLSTEELREHLGDRVVRRIISQTEPFVMG